MSEQTSGSGSKLAFEVPSTRSNTLGVLDLIIASEAPGSEAHHAAVFARTALAAETRCEPDDCSATICDGPHHEVLTTLGRELIRYDQQPLGTPIEPTS